MSRLAPLEPQALAYDKPLCASLDGFTLHAATRAGALDPAGREALLRYVLRPPVAQERVEQRPDGLVRITLKKAYTDGTIAVDMDPLSLLCRLATSVPPPRLHTIRYAGVLAPASPWRSRLAPLPPQAAAASDEPGRPDHAGAYRPWAELLARTFAVDVLACPKCQGRMRLLAMVGRPGEHRPLPRRGGRGDRGAAPLAGSRSARTGRAACSAGRRSVRSRAHRSSCRELGPVKVVHYRDTDWIDEWYYLEDVGKDILTAEQLDGERPVEPKTSVTAVQARATASRSGSRAEDRRRVSPSTETPTR